MYKTIKELVSEINEKTTELESNLEKAIEKGNKTAMRRARKLTLELSKLYKTLRADSNYLEKK